MKSAILMTISKTSCTILKFFNCEADFVKCSYEDRKSIFDIRNILR